MQQPVHLVPHLALPKELLLPVLRQCGRKGLVSMSMVNTAYYQIITGCDELSKCILTLYLDSIILKKHEDTIMWSTGPHQVYFDKVIFYSPEKVLRKIKKFNSDQAIFRKDPVKSHMFREVLLSEGDTMKMEADEVIRQRQMPNEKPIWKWEDCRFRGHSRDNSRPDVFLKKYQCWDIVELHERNSQEEKLKVAESIKEAKEGYIIKAADKALELALPAIRNQTLAKIACIAAQQYPSCCIYPLNLISSNSYESVMYDAHDIVVELLFKGRKFSGEII